VRWRNERKAHALRLGRWKYVHTAYVDFEELYDLQLDPGERVNLLAGGDAGPRARADDLRRRLDAFRAAAAPLPSEFVDQDKMAQRLEALGYLEAEDPQTGAEADGR